MRTITQYFIFVAIVVILGYDVYAYIKGGQEATISSVIITDWIYNYPAFTFACGFFAGHLFWPLARKK